MSKKNGKGISEMENQAGKNFLKKYGAVIAVLCVAAGLFLMLYNGGDESKKNAEDTYSGFESGNPEEYARFVESKVKEICSGIDGVGNVSVAVTLSGGYRAVYAQNSQNTSSGYKNEVVLMGSGSTEKALIVGYEYPQIGGIGIVCDGGSSSVIRSRIISLVSSAFDISTNKIEVVGR